MLELRLAGIDGIVTLALHTAAEPACAQRIAALAEAGVLDGVELRRRRELVELGDVDLATWAPLEPRRARHTSHIPGAIGWAWTRTPGDGRGSFYVMVEEERGFDAPYGIVGEVTAGLELLRALPVRPTVRRRGEKLPPPTMIDSIRCVRGLDVAARR